MLSSARSFLRRPPLAALLSAAVLGSVWAFIEIADEVREDETRHLDERILLAMREPGDLADPIGSDRVEEMARDLTALGGMTILTGVTLIAIGIALFAGQKRLAWLGAGSVILGSFAMSLLKHGFDRPRPDLVEHGTVVHNPSFPSGHSMMAALVYLTLGILLARTQPKKRVRAFIVCIAVLITILVGISRVYLGVHWPTDVLGGWMLGGAWAIVFWLLARRLNPPNVADR